MSEYQINVIYGKQSYQVPVLSSDTVSKLKLSIFNVTDIDVSYQRIIYKGSLVSDGTRVLSDLGVQDGDTIHLVTAGMPKDGGSQGNATNSNVNENTDTNENNTGTVNAPPAVQLPDFSNMDIGSLAEMYENNPEMKQHFENMMNDPNMVYQFVQNNSMLSELVNNNPILQQMMVNPAAMKQMLNPEFLEDIVSALDTDPFTEYTPQPIYGGNPFGNVGTVSDPESAYSSQLQQLEEMGFTDREANLTALKASMGNVEAALERLFQ
eukprot:TRINITY_DN11044_c0_g1_i1.p1 TRINITY_DN11044_c0_g1~~TRINITY_DN11044_c0_g1_i1.p1  ORF type:complete len:266 (+),score=77.50 TRINITY_DN11044_c0_g1_i1:57-854(+)